MAVPNLYPGSQTHLGANVAVGGGISITSSNGNDALISPAIILAALGIFAPCTFAKLPATPGVGMWGLLIDCSVNPSGNFAATAAGGGSYVTPVYWNGSAWKIF